MELKETVAITGCSGSGKSTFLNLISGLEKPSSGIVYWNGIKVLSNKSKHFTKLRGKTLGFVSQCQVIRYGAIRGIDLMPIVI